MAAVSVETLEELKQTWFRLITCILHSVNCEVNSDLPISIELALRKYNIFFMDWLFA